MNVTTIKAPTETKPETTSTFRDEWINLKGPGFSTFVFKHIDKFKDLSGELFSEAVAKWQKLYPTFSCPFVAKNPEDAQEATGEAQGDDIRNTMHPDSDEPPMANELERLKAEIKMHDRNNREAVKQAMADTGITLPTTIDGCRVVLEAIEARIAGR